MFSIKIMSVLFAAALLHQAACQQQQPNSLLLVRETVKETEAMQQGHRQPKSSIGPPRGSRDSMLPTYDLGGFLSNTYGTAMNLNTVKGLNKDLSELSSNLANSYNSNFNSLSNEIQQGQQTVKGQYTSGIDMAAQFYEFLRDPIQACQRVVQESKAAMNQLQSQYGQASESMASSVDMATKPVNNLFKGFGFGKK